MYTRTRGGRRQSGSFMDYFMPFLIIVAIGIILVLVVKLFQAVWSDDDVHAAYLHVVEGSVDMRTWGSEDFITLSSDTLLLQGDEIMSSSEAKVIVEFEDGTLLRINGGTNVNFEEFGWDKDEYSMSLMLVDGRIWVNKFFDRARNTDVKVKMANVSVDANEASSFELENDFDEIVRVIKGKDINVDVYNREGTKVVASEELGVGQEMVFGDEALDRYFKYQSPDIIAAISDDFKLEEWYLWNGNEDTSPTEYERVVGGDQFVKVEPVVTEVDEVEAEGEESAEDGEVGDEPVEDEPTDDVVEDDTADDPEETVEHATSADLVAPTITSVAGITETNADGFYVVTTQLATLTGTVSGATKVVVNNYTLTKFLPGDSTWTYFANAAYGLMVEGENTYEVYATDPAGNKSESIFVKVLYEPAPEPEPEEDIPSLYGP